MTLEEDGHKVILPIWHGVTKSQVAEHSPILADRLAADTKRGVAYVARAIEDVVFDPQNGSPSAETPSVGRRFIELLDATQSVSTIRTFLIAHRAVLLQAYAGFNESFWLEAGDGSKGFDLCVKIQGPSRPVINQFLVFLPPSEKPFLDGFPTLSLIRSVAALHHLAGRSNLSEGTVVVGRRDNLSNAERTLLKNYNASLSDVTVHTYDWLIDLAMNLNDWAISEARRLDDWSNAHDYEGFKNPTKAESEPN